MGASVMIERLIVLLISPPLLYGVGIFYWRVGVGLYRLVCWAGVAWADSRKHSGVSIMPNNQWPEFATCGNGPRYDHSAAAAAEILNRHFDSTQPKAVLFGRILFTILEAMNRAEEELRGIRWEPSEN
jgi:hypothetical protein